MLNRRILAGIFVSLFVVNNIGVLPSAVAQPACDPTSPQPPLCASQVEAVINRATTVLDMPMVVAVVDRVGNILGVFRKTGAPTQVAGNFSREALLNNPQFAAVEVAISLARTAAFFSNNQAPLSSRTVRFISGVHFPPGVMFTPNAALYGIENTNRGCDLNTTFLPGKEVPRAKALNDLTCTSTDRSGCSLGVTTGKIDFFDSDASAVNPGGIPLFKGDTIVGGVGVVGNFPGNLAELVALVAAFLPSEGVLPVPVFFTKDLRERVFIDGIRLPFVNVDVPKVVKQLTKGKLPKGLKADPAPTGEMLVSPRDGQCFDADENGGVCRAAPEGYLVGPLAGSRLTQEEVDNIVQNSLKTANETRAVIRFPRGSRAKMMISVADTDGTLLAVYRMPDATIFSIDVATAKSRNVVYFSGFDPNLLNDLPGVPLGTSISNRTLSFGSQPFYPPGIDTGGEGPFFRSLYINDTLNPCSQGTQAPNPNQSGIVFFPGSLPLYKNGEVVGGLGISGDGVEQDDYVTVGGATGFEPPDSIRADQVFVRGVRLGYLKFPRNPEKSGKREGQ
ncbi:MAG: heme-binding protein [Candidatus Binatia bacterium]